jgi:alkylhydroperoxidase family enzyme
MLRAILERQFRKEEKLFGAGALDYVRHILRVSPGAFFKFAQFLPLSKYRRVLPAEAQAVAVLVATRDEDCGTCVQIGVNLARKPGVSADLLRAVLDRRPETLPAPLADVYHFTEAVVQATYQESELRERVRKHYGEAGLVEVALAMASCRVFPRSAPWATR